ncbi:MAG: UDP-3-O-acyl-N-acetylglucosamine deacetylase [Elusimicrobiota bacterium]
MKAKRRTIKNEFIIEGKGIHKGLNNLLIVRPRIEGKGIIFINTNTGEFVEASIGNVSNLERGTSVSNGKFSVSTIEHLLSAFMAFDIDDVEIEITGDEIPILDGSAKTFSDMIFKSGVVDKNEDVDEFYGFENFIFVNGESFYKVEKSDSFKIECLYEHDHPMVGRQLIEFDINIDNYVKEIAPARTFGFDWEIEYLKSRNLALGGSLENAIVLSKDSMLNTKPLRFKDEFVRHKMLDLLGDLKLLGMRFFNIKITAYRPSHKANYEFCKLIMARRDFYGKAQ